MSPHPELLHVRSVPDAGSLLPELAGSRAGGGSRSQLEISGPSALTLQQVVGLTLSIGSLISKLYFNLNQACRNPGMLESGIPAGCDICRQFCSYLQTIYAYLKTILSDDENHVLKWNLAGILYFSIPGFLPSIVQYYCERRKIGKY